MAVEYRFPGFFGTLYGMRRLREELLAGLGQPEEGPYYKVTLYSITVKLPEREPGDKVLSAPDADAVLRQIYADLDQDQEHFAILSLDAANQIRGYKVIHTGGATQSLVDTKVVFRTALLLGANGIIVAHNHPSGDSTPSPEDRAVTKRLVEAGRLVSVPVLDHLILVPGRYTSMAEQMEMGL
jgi:DNA repair protein RadC